MRLGLVLADNYSAVCFAKNSRLTKHIAIPSTGNAFKDADSVLSSVEGDIRKLGRKLSSVAVVTDLVRRSLLEQKNLDKVALFRFSSPEGRDSPSLLSRKLGDEVLASFFVVEGGHGFDGRTISKPNPDEIKRCYSRVGNSANAFVVTSPFSILYPNHEQMGAAELSKLGANRIWTSLDVSNMTSMLDRETTAVLTASTAGIIERVETEVLSKLKSLGCKPVVYFGRNNGSIFGSALAKRFPLDTAWSVEGHSAAGASKSERISDSLVAGSADGETWLAGTRKGKPITRRISYLNEMLLHVSSPIIAHFPRSSPDHVKISRFQAMSQLAHAKKVFAADLSEKWNVPFKVMKRKNSGDYAAISAATAVVEWEWSSNVPKDADRAIAEKKLRGTIQSQMKQSGARTFTLSHLNSRAGINLPDGAITLSLQARGSPV
jgi:hypothetical protein